MVSGRIGVFGGALVGLASHAAGQVQVVTDRAAWLALSGPPTFTEDFAAFTGNPNFQAGFGGPRSLAGGAARIGVDAAAVFSSVNFIDTAQSFPAFGSGKYANCTVTWGGGSSGDRTSVFIDFAAPVTAFGFRTWSAASSQGVRVGVLSGQTELTSFLLDNGSGSFRGFVTQPGVSVTRVLLSAAAPSPGASENFGLDDLEGVAVPAPGGGAALGLAAGGLAARRRRRRASPTVAG